MDETTNGAARRGHADGDAGGPASTETGPRDADGTDADGTDGDATDGTDGDGTDADGTDGDATDTTDGDGTDADGTDTRHLVTVATLAPEQAETGSARPMYR